MVFTRQGPKHTGRKGSYVGHHWFDDIEVIDDDERVMPDTVPHEFVATHRHGCMCPPCQAYPAQLLWDLKWRHQNPGKRPRR